MIDGKFAFNPRFLLFSAMSAAIGFTSVAYAQDQGAATVGDVVVTAQRRAQSVQDVPIAVSAFTRDSLVERVVSDVSALTAVVPNVTLDASTPFSGSTAVLGATIRGIGSSDFAFNIDPGVGVYLDGVYLGRSVGANQDLLDVERIEVLKGPQGTLFGRNAIGGAIQIITHDPGDELRFVGDVTTGSYDRLQARGTVDLPISEHLSSSLSFGIHTRDGYQERLPFTSATPFVTDGPNAFFAAGRATSDTSSGDNTWSMRGKVRYDNDADLRVIFSADYTNVDQEATANTVLATTEFIPGPFAGLAANNIPGTALDVVTGSSGFLFAGLYNFCIGASPAALAARNAQNLCGPRASVNGLDTLAGLGGVNIDANPLNNRLPYDSRWANPTGDIDESYASGPNFSKLDQYGVGLTLEYDLTDTLTFKSISSYRTVDFSAGVDLDGSPLEFLEPTFIVDQTQWSQEFQLNGSAFGEQLNYVFGAYAFGEEGDLRDFVTFSEGFVQIDGPGQVETKAYAAFGQLDYRWADFGITLGGRYTHEDKVYHGFQSDRNGFNYKMFNCLPVGAVCAGALGFPVPSDPFRYYPPEPSEQSFNNFSPKVGLQYHATEDLMLYASWSRGYKTGGWTTRLSNPLPTAPTFAEEEAETTEIGVKSTWFDRRLQLNAAAFTTKYDGIQLNFQQGISPTIQNAGEAEINGFELELNAAPGGGFTVQGSVGVLDATYTSVLGPAQVAPSGLQLGVFEGADLPKAPELKVNISPRYETPLGEGTLVLLGDWTYTSEMRNDTEGTILLLRPDTNIFNVAASYRWPDDRVELTVGGTNVSDERYIVTGQAQVAGGVIYGTYSRPAEWYARLRFNF